MCSLNICSETNRPSEPEGSNFQIELLVSRVNNKVRTFKKTVMKLASRPLVTPSYSSFSPQLICIIVVLKVSKLYYVIYV